MSDDPASTTDPAPGGETALSPSTREALADLVAGIAQRMKTAPDRGRVATYIPELAHADLGAFGLAVAPLDGPPIAAGDAEMPFSIQSISKVFALILALDRLGSALWDRVGVEPSGDPFNSIVQLEYEKGKPRNPFINAGAIAVDDALLAGQQPEATIADILAFMGRLCPGEGSADRVRVDPRVAASERATGARNRALANFMAAEGRLASPVEDILEVYFNQCALAMSCRQLALAGRHLAAAGSALGPTDPALTPDRARRVLALMLTCGLYDASGDFAFRVGVPAKSGVGGGVLAVVPGVASIAAWCPGLDASGNSLLAVRAIEEVVQATAWSIFTAR